MNIEERRREGEDRVEMGDVPSMHLKVLGDRRRGKVQQAVVRKYPNVSSKKLLPGFQRVSF